MIMTDMIFYVLSCVSCDAVQCHVARRDVIGCTSARFATLIGCDDAIV